MEKIHKALNRRKKEQNNSGSFSAVAENMLKVAEVAEKKPDDRPALFAISRSTPEATPPQPAVEPALTLAPVRPGGALHRTLPGPAGPGSEGEEPAYLPGVL
jgi:hypothetical protein